MYNYLTALGDGLSLESYDLKSLQVSRSLLWILSDLNNALVWMGSVRPPIFNSSSSLTVPSAPITIGIIVTFMFNYFFCFLARSRYLSLFFSTFIKFYSVISRKGKVYCSAGCLFLSTIIRSGCLDKIRWSICI